MGKLFSLIFQGDLHTATGDKVIPLEDFTLLLEAETIVQKAREDAERLRSETETACETLRAEAKEQGFQEGLAQLNDQILKLDEEKKRLRHEMNKLILPIALKAAKKIVAKELELHPETIVNIIMEALEPVMHSHRVTIFVSRHDREVLEKAKTDIRSKLEQIETFAIKERDDVAPGGCIIETEGGIINATIENQWQALEAAFERYLKS
jgi:type III secretion protein L